MKREITEINNRKVKNYGLHTQITNFLMMMTLLVEIKSFVMPSVVFVWYVQLYNLHFNWKNFISFINCSKKINLQRQILIWSLLQYMVSLQGGAEFHRNRYKAVGKNK